MIKILNTILLPASGLLAASFLANLLFHLFFYLIDGNLGKFLSPIWMTLNGIMIVLCMVFVLMLMIRRRLSH